MYKAKYKDGHKQRETPRKNPEVLQNWVFEENMGCFTGAELLPGLRARQNSFSSEEMAL